MTSVRKVSARQGGAHAGGRAAVAAASRQKILETAARLLRDEGYGGTTLRAIGARCGMHAGSVYHHFGSKDAIVTEVLDLGVQRVFDAVRSAVEALPPRSALEPTLRCVIDAHLRALLQSHDFTSANFRVFGHAPATVRNLHRPLRRRYEDYWRELLLGLQQRGDAHFAGDVTRLVYFLVGAMNWAAEWYDEDKSTLEQVAAELASVVVHGIQGDTSVTERSKVAE